MTPEGYLPRDTSRGMTIDRKNRAVGSNQIIVTRTLLHLRPRKRSLRERLEMTGEVRL